MNTRRRLLAAALAAPVVLASCKVRTINYFPGTPARVRAVNVMLDSTAVDIVEGDSVVFGAIAFEVGTDYIELENTQRTFSLRFAGQPGDLEQRRRRARRRSAVHAPGRTARPTGPS